MRASKDMDAVCVAYGEKLAYMVWASSTLVTAIVIAFVKAPLVAAVLFCVLPLALGVLFIIGFVGSTTDAKAIQLSSDSSSFAERLFSSVRVAQAFTIETRLVDALRQRYAVPLARILTWQSLVRGLETGTVYFCVFLIYVVVFTWGGHLLSIKPSLEVGNVLTAFWNFFNALFSLAIIFPHISAFADAQNVIKNIRDTIERQPQIDVRSDKGARFFPTAGQKVTFPDVELEDVTFAYPSRPNVASLQGVSLRMEAGKWSAIVGPSGSGKSTVANLLSREYDVAQTETTKEVRDTLDPEKHPSTAKGMVQGSGRVLVGGRDLREYNVAWIRSQVCVIGQTSHIFTDSVLNNVTLGFDVGGDDEEQVRQRCIKALRCAQAWDFVSQLDAGINALIKESQLSGGQKQRIALARAFFRQPAVLVLDEATSALDAATESAVWSEMVQQLRNRGTTVVVIAHRLATIRQADRIIVMQAGHVLEQGTHDELVNTEQGLYREMVLTQSGHFSKPKQLDEKGEKVDTDSQSDSDMDEDSKTVTPNAGLDVVSKRPCAHRSILHLLCSYMAKEATSFLVGVASALALAVAQIIIAWKVGDAVIALSERDKSASISWGLWFLLLTTVAGLTGFLGSFGLEAGSQRMAVAMRLDAIQALLAHPVSFFEARGEEDRSAGAVSAAVDTYPQHVASATGLVMNQLLISIGVCVGNLILAIVLSWKVALPMLGPVVALVLAGWFNVFMIERSQQRARKPSQRAASIIAEASTAIRTVNGLGVERQILARFDRDVLNPADFRATIAPLVFGSIGFAIGQGLLFWLIALFFYWSGQELVKGNVDRKVVFSVLEALLQAALSAGKLFTFGQDLSRASSALHILRSWLNEAGSTASPSNMASKLGSDDNGSLVLADVDMRYPNAPAFTLQGLDLEVRPGQTVALCGPSGSGKSSAVALMARFYEPSSGSIKYGGRPLSSISLAQWRAKLALVPQEPMLFQGSIRWNIALGNTASAVSDAAIEKALGQASILDFVRALPHGLDTDLGLSGSSLSGGQKQRLCLARALVRQPRLLLLDEPTSALDPQSEASVQAALVRLAQSSTSTMSTIVVAHRLSTIRSADVICVVDQGRIVQRGRHEDLVAVPGPYQSLIQAQL